MHLNKMLMVSALALMIATPALAQTVTPPAGTPPLSAAEETQRDVNQQDRIENGLKDGDLTTKEAAHLENGEKKIDQTESRDLKDGKLTPAEEAHIQQMQNRESAQIKKDDTNAAKGNPNGTSDKRMQADVQRDANQEQRIHNGVAGGGLTNKEAGHLEGGQARADRAEARAGANGHISGREQRNIQHRENHDSRHVHRDRHNGHRRHEQ